MSLVSQYRNTAFTAVLSFLMLDWLLIKSGDLQKAGALTPLVNALRWGKKKVEKSDMHLGLLMAGITLTLLVMPVPLKACCLSKYT